MKCRRSLARAEVATSAALLALLAGCAPAPQPSVRPEILELAGLAPGLPQRCVPIQQSEALRLGADRTILYGRAGTIWMNRLGEACTGIRRTDVLIAEPVGSRYCRGDRVRSADPVTGVSGPGCTFGDFVPYRR